MQTQRWCKNKRDGKETISCNVRTARVQRGREIKTVLAIQSAVSDRVGKLLTSSPIVQDIQEAITKRRTTSRVYGYWKES